MARSDPRTSLLFGGVAAVSAAAGIWPAVAALVGTAVWAAWERVRPRALAWRLLPLVAGFAGFAIAAPFAPRETVAVVLRGFAVSVVVVAVAGVVPWTRAVGVLQVVRAPRALIAFLAIVARHLVTVRDEAEQLRRTMLLRGAFGSGARLRSIRVLLGRLIPLALARADRVADALTLRGFEGRIPAAGPWRPGWRDLPVALVAISIAGVAVIEVVR